MPSAKANPKKSSLSVIMISVVFISALLLIGGMAILSDKKNGGGLMYFKHPLDVRHSANKKS